MEVFVLSFEKAGYLDPRLAENCLWLLITGRSAESLPLIYGPVTKRIFLIHGVGRERVKHRQAIQI